MDDDHLQMVLYSRESILLKKYSEKGLHVPL